MTPVRAVTGAFQGAAGMRRPRHDAFVLSAEVAATAQSDSATNSQCPPTTTIAPEPATKATIAWCGMSLSDHNGLRGPARGVDFVEGSVLAFDHEDSADACFVADACPVGEFLPA